MEALLAWDLLFLFFSCDFSLQQSAAGQQQQRDACSEVSSLQSERQLDTQHQLPHQVTVESRFQTSSLNYPCVCNIQRNLHLPCFAIINARGPALQPTVHEATS